MEYGHVCYVYYTATLLSKDLPFLKIKIHLISIIHEPDITCNISSTVTHA